MDSRYEYILSLKSDVSSIGGFSSALRTVRNDAATVNTSLADTAGTMRDIRTEARGLDNLNFDLQTDIAPLSRVSNILTTIRGKIGAVRNLVFGANTSNASNSITALRSQIDEVTKRRNLAINAKEIGQANSEIAALQAKIQKLENLPPQGIFQRFGALRNLVGGIVPMLVGIGLAAGLGSLGADIVKVTSDFKKYNAVLTNSFRSSVLAGQAMKDLQKFAADTPFDLNNLTNSYVKLVNRGFTPTMAEMRKLGDVASSQGKDIDQWIEAVLDAETGEMERLKEFGVTAKKEGDKVSFNFKGQKTVIQNSAKDIRGYLLGLGDMQGVAGSMKAISGTLAGQLSNMSDNFDAFKLRVGTALAPLLTFGIRIANKLLDISGVATEKLLPTFEKWGAWIQANAPMIESGLQGAGIAVGVVSAGFLALNATMLLNPMFWVVGAIEAGVIAFGYFYAKSEMFRASVTGIWEVSKTLFTSVWENGKQAIGGLIDLVSGLVSGMEAAVNMDFSAAADNFKKAWQGAKDVGEVVYKASPLGMAINSKSIVSGISKDFNKGFAEGQKEFQTVDEANKANQLRAFQDEQNKKRNADSEKLRIDKEKEELAKGKPTVSDLLKKGATLADLRANETYQPTTADILNKRNGKGNLPNLPSSASGGLAGVGSDGGTSIGNVTGDSKASKNINNTIQNLSINITIATTNVTEGAGEIKRLVGAAIFDAVNDLNYAN